jgi:DNA repair exonuclease SbcCD ATPase subunit
MGYKQEAVRLTGVFQTAAKAVDPNADAQLDARIAEVQQRIDAVAGERVREAQLQSAYNSVSSSFATAQSNLRVAETNLATANRALTQWETQLEKTKNSSGKPCSTCSQPLTDKHLQAAITVAMSGVDERKEMVTAASEEVEARKVKLGNAEKMLNDADAELVKHREGMTDISGATQELGALQREKQILAAEAAEVQRLKDQARVAAERWKQAQAQTNPFLPMIDGYKQNVAEREQDIETCKGAYTLAVEDEAYAQAVVTVFAPAGVRARRLDEATPYLNQQTAHYLGSLADGAIEAFWTTLTENKSKTEVREKFSVTVEKVSANGQGSFKNLSGGEKRKVRLACALALQDLVATRASKSIDLWVGDEVDDALDDAGIERLMGVLEEKARQRGTVLVISHNDIKDFVRRQFVVTKVNGCATVVES